MSSGVDYTSGFTQEVITYFLHIRWLETKKGVFQIFLKAISALLI